MLTLSITVENNTDMIGDLILWIKRVWKQQTCIHDYKWVYRKDTGGSFEQCSKCEKIR